MNRKQNSGGSWPTTNHLPSTDVIYLPIVGRKFKMEGLTSKTVSVPIFND